MIMRAELWVRATENKILRHSPGRRSTLDIPKHLSVLHVVAPAPFGGLESVVRMLAAGHARQGHSVRVATVLSPGSAQHPFVASLEAEGIPVVPLRIGDRDYRGERKAIRQL